LRSHRSRGKAEDSEDGVGQASLRHSGWSLVKMLEAFSSVFSASFFAIQRRKICEVLMSIELKQGTASIYVFFAKAASDMDVEDKRLCAGIKGLHLDSIDQSSFLSALISCQ
jgi:hypothetical protein